MEYKYSNSSTYTNSLIHYCCFYSHMVFCQVQYIALTTDALKHRLKCRLDGVDGVPNQLTHAGSIVIFWFGFNLGIFLYVLYMHTEYNFHFLNFFFFFHKQYLFSLHLSCRLLVITFFLWYMTSDFLCSRWSYFKDKKQL